MFSGDHGWTVPVDTEPTWSVNYGDFDNDGVNEFVLGTAVDVRFYDMDGQIKTAGMPVFPPDNYLCPLVVGDLDDDDIDDVVALGLSNHGTIYVHRSGAADFQIDVPDWPYWPTIHDGRAA